MQQTEYFQYSKFKKRYDSIQNIRKRTTLELDLSYSKANSYVKYRFNSSKHVGEKCGKQCISSILSLKRVITSAKINANLRHSKLI